MIVGVVALGVGVLMLATGGLGRVAASIGSSVTGFVGSLTATPVPSKAVDEAADSPVLSAPEEPYTKQASVDILGTVPAAVAGKTQARIRLYVAIGDGAPGVVSDTPVGTSQRFLFPDVALSQGLNTFSATIVSSTNLESEPSASIAYILDTSKPRIVISGPKNNAVVNANALKVVGQTQARSAISVRNASTNATVSGSADGKGAFEVMVPLATGTNTIQVTATDPAGNANTATVAVRRGTGALTARLAASDYQIKASTLPERVTLSVTVSDPDGKALKGASITFTLAVPGVPAIASGELTTASNGRASFTTTIPKGATRGQTSVTVIVSTAAFGNTTDRTVITIN
ncbi:MAG TPA: Ig-like domain-containing protein [Candidatus Limnocylindrales bacterium]|nr:Ig-like domain-containing protein [Candidatus Limnocylindrales bacterium]